jgi:hypothetical protein
MFVVALVRVSEELGNPGGLLFEPKEKEEIRVE